LTAGGRTREPRSDLSGVHSRIVDKGSQRRTCEIPDFLEPHLVLNPMRCSTSAKTAHIGSPWAPQESLNRKSIIACAVGTAFPERGPIFQPLHSISPSMGRWRAPGPALHLVGEKMRRLQTRQKPASTFSGQTNHKALCDGYESYQIVRGSDFGSKARCLGHDGFVDGSGEAFAGVFFPTM